MPKSVIPVENIPAPKKRPMTITNSNHKRDNSGKTKHTSMLPTTETEEMARLNKGSAEKGKKEQTKLMVVLNETYSFDHDIQLYSIFNRIHTSRISVWVISLLEFSCSSNTRLWDHASCFE
jgi:hypothetical protein